MLQLLIIGGAILDKPSKIDGFFFFYKFLEVAGYRNQFYKNNFPTGSWLGVKELAFPEFLIEIELEVHID